MAEQKSQYTGLLGWVDERMPTLMSEYKKHLSEYYAPKNFNIWYIFGGLAIFGTMGIVLGPLVVRLTIEALQLAREEAGLPAHTSPPSSMDFRRLENPPPVETGRSLR